MHNQSQDGNKLNTTARKERKLALSTFLYTHACLVQPLKHIISSLLTKNFKTSKALEMALMVISSLVFCVLAIVAGEVPEKSNLETYIVHVEAPDGQLFSESEDLESWYRSFLPTTTENSNFKSRLVYSYRNVMKGFAARLSPEGVKEMEKKDGFYFCAPTRKLSLATHDSSS